MTKSDKDMFNLAASQKREMSGQDLTKSLTKVLKIKVCEMMMTEQFVQKFKKKC